ncbi:MAG: ATP-dependent helicase [Candidatus Pacebacteria bacterium]|nr:ATP-dependent helicase [Candidatus Paceibacterota bacterium]
MSRTDAFDALYAQLNDRQREAVDAIDGPVMVIAGPGTGKTKILTLRIAAILLRTDTPPEAILALTFTESGAAEMRGRLAAIIGTDAYRVSVTTFHAYCNSVIQEYPEALSVLAGAASITESDQAVLLQELIDTTAGIELLRPINAPDLYLKAVISSINRLKREGVGCDRVVAVAASEESTIVNAVDLYHEKGVHKGKMKGAYQEQLKQILKLRELAILYEAYQKMLRVQRLYDFNDMIMEVARALETNEELRLILQEKHQYLLVDEHQDTNNAQNRIIELLASFWQLPNLFVVGDAKQAIYRFQGASLENFLYFKSLYPDVKLIALQDNYRSSQLILDAAEGIRPGEDGALTAQSGHDNALVHVLALSGPDVEYWSIAEHIRSRLQAGVKPESIAILTRDNSDAVAMSEFLQKLSVPYTLSTQQDLLADPYLHQLIRIIDAIRNFGSPGPLLVALHAPTLGVDPLDIYKLTEFCRQGRNPYDVIRSSMLLRDAGIEGVETLTKLSANFASWSRDAEQPEASQALERIIRESGLLGGIISSAQAPDTLARLHELYDLLRSRIQRDRTITLRQFAEHLDFLREHGIALSSHTGTSLPGRVRVMTAHKSKGMEFDYVYIIDAIDGHWGSRQRRELIRIPVALFQKQRFDTPPSPINDDEERNIFYVALTRARNQIVLSYSLRDSTGSESLPTQYIADINPSLLACIDTAGLEYRWLEEGAIRYQASPPTIPLGADKEFLNELFARHGLSVTALNNYLKCPWKYFYTNLLRIPEAPAFALMYGNAVDRALEEFFNRFANGITGTRESLVALFEDFIRHQPFQKPQLDVALSRGRSALEGYYDTYSATWKPTILNQLRVTAVELAEGVLINGKIDKVELIDASGNVIVVDYKTGKPKTRNQIIGAVKDGDGNYMRQLIFYKLLLDRFQGGKYRMGEGVIDFIEPDAKGKWHRERFAVTPEMAIELAADIVRVAKEIQSLSFWNQRCSDSECDYCELRVLQSHH